MSVFADRLDRGPRAGEPETTRRSGAGEKQSSRAQTGDGGLDAAEDRDSESTPEKLPGGFSDIEEAARIRLQHSHYQALRRLDCSFADGVLTLAGRVPTFHYKQLAQTVVANISGVRCIENLIDVG